MTKLKVNARSMFVMAAIAISTSAVSSAQYDFVTFKVPGSTSTSVSGISNNNQISGSYETASGDIYGYTHNLTTGVWVYPISDPKGPTYTYANSSNTAGTVVGYYWTPPGRNNAMFDQFGTFTDVTQSGCTVNTVVTGINDSGTMTGYCEYSGANGVLQTMAWENGPTNVTFSCFDSPFTMASAVNNWLLTVGSFSQSGGQVTTGFIATDQGTCTAVNYPNSANTVLGGVNDLGAITGTYWLTENGKSNGFILNGSTYTTVNVPGTKATSLGQINNNGWFVGSYVDRRNRLHAFYATPISGASRLIDPGN
jgi:hypothetical protein